MDKEAFISALLKVTQLVSGTVPAPNECLHLNFKLPFLNDVTISSPCCLHPSTKEALKQVNL